MNIAPYIPSDDVIAALMAGKYNNVFAVLGLHHFDGYSCIRVFQPHASSVNVIADEKVFPMTKIGDSGLFMLLTEKHIAYYQLQFENEAGSWQSHDPYAFLPVWSQLDNELFAIGQRERCYHVLGANVIEHYGVKGVHFAVWAPNASRVSVVGHFNGWDGRLHVMRHHPASGIWEIFIPGLTQGELYKYELLDGNGNLLPLKSDPYAFYCEKAPNFSSIVWQKGQYQWQDDSWMQKRGTLHQRHQPISIYEVHLGSWRRVSGEPNAYLDYRQLAHELAQHVKALGFTHIELLPVSEYPFDGSWGYQPVNLFAPTSRFGTPDDFKYFVDYMHQHGIGVIIDWVPAHFPEDSHGLAQFDGTHLYDHADPRLGFHQDWNTCIYNYGRTEVAQFLIDNACFWLDEYHIDGLRVDAVASMLYLDYSREDGQWLPNIYGGNENLEAVAFIRRLNETVYARFPGIMTLAEESTSWDGVTRMTNDNGLGFGYKWNMGWMHDTLQFMSKDSIHRQFHYHDMTFGMIYAYSENFVLPLSHDEVVHGKGSLINKMPGDEWQKLANLRAYLAFMWTHPGKKLLFMGGEFGQWQEWNHDQSLDWHLLAHQGHADLMKLVGDLNTMFRRYPALHALDCDPRGFCWIEASNQGESVLAFARFDGHGGAIVVVCNFTPVVRHDYYIGLPFAGKYREILNTDSAYYGGSNIGNMPEIWSQPHGAHGFIQSMQIVLPPLSVCVFEYAGEGA